MAGIEVTTPPESEPLTKEEVKDHLGLNGDDYDNRVHQLIAAARKQVERLTNRRLIQQSLAIYFELFPVGREIFLPIAPVSEISSVQYYDSDGALQTFAASKYFTDIISEPGRIVLDSSEAWPDTKAGRPNAVKINVVAGYGDSSADIDEGLTTAMLMIIEEAFDRPDKGYLEALTRVQTHMLSPYQLRGFR